MAIDKPWAVFRPQSDGVFELVYQAEKIQEARYWLMYIAEVGDALFKTSFHARYVGDGTPTYDAHLEERQKSERSEDKWRKQVGIEGLKVEFRTDAESRKVDVDGMLNSRS